MHYASHAIIPHNEARCRRLIARAIDTFSLNLNEFIVLTEAATGYYMLTALIAALAGAEKVYALTRDSHYGSAQDVATSTLELAQRWGMENKVDILFDRNDPRLIQADIVTNLGFVRPLNAQLLQRLKPTAVIPLMWETWEYRTEELDLAECHRLGLPVLGTNEHHPALRIFEYIGYIAMKLLFSLDIEIRDATIAVVGSGEFAAMSADTLRTAGSRVILVNPQKKGALQTDRALKAIKIADGMVFVEHHSRRMLLGPGGDLRAEDLRSLNPGLVVAHICGGVDREDLTRCGFRCSPDLFAPPGYMSAATDYLGPKPLINLHTAGLRIGEVMARSRASNPGATVSQIEQAVLSQLPLAQGFPQTSS